MSTLRTDFGRVLRATRKRAGLSQEDFADRVSLSRPSIVNIELGRQGISLEQLYLFASALGVAPNELLPSTTSVLSDALLKKLETHKGELPRGTDQWVASVLRRVDTQSK